MSGQALLLVLGSSLGWAGLDACRKLLARHMSSTPVVLCLTLGQMPLFGLWLLIDGRYTIQPGYVVPAAFSVLLNTLANLMFVRAVRLSPLSLTVPFLSLTPVFTTAMGLVLLGEVPTPRQLVGIALVVAGALGLHSAGEGPGHVRRLLRAYAGEPGSVLMTGVALLWSITGPLDKVATARSSVPIHALVACGVMTLGLGLVLVLNGQFRELRAARRQAVPLFGAVVFATAGLGLQLMAFQRLFVALVDVIKRVIGLVAAVLLGHLCFDEAITTRKLWAIALMALGITLVLL